MPDKLTYYNAINNSDIIIDQFYLGAMGGVALEFLHEAGGDCPSKFRL